MTKSIDPTGPSPTGLPESRVEGRPETGQERTLWSTEESTSPSSSVYRFLVRSEGSRGFQSTYV